MVFENGKYYRHIGTGELLHIVGAVNTTMYGNCLVGESNRNFNLLPIGTDESNAENWVESTKYCWDRDWEARK